MSQHFGTDKRQRHLQTSVFSFLLFLLNSPHLSLAVNATAICTHHGCICNFHVFGGNLRHSQGNKSLKQVIQTLNKYIHSVTTNSHTMFICSTLLNHIHTKGNYTLFSKKALLQTSVPWFGVLVGWFRQLTNNFLSSARNCTVPESFDKYFRARNRLLHIQRIWKSHGQ